jgi:RNA methyltransferase, TrmH family
MTITSSHNQRLKEIHKLRMRRRARERAGRFVAEGEDLLQAADAAGWPAVERFCAVGSGLPGIEVEAKQLAAASGLGSGTRTLAVYEERWAREPLGPLCVFLHGVHDPGNVGAVLRSAEAFGASCVAIGPGSSDPFGPKAVRASMGAVFAVPLWRAAAGDVVLDQLPGTKIALVTGGGTPLPELWRSGTGGWDETAKVRGRGSGGPGLTEITLLIGAEREGLPQDAIEAADLTAHIPIHTDSLNAAMAATIALYEASRMARAR